MDPEGKAMNFLRFGKRFLPGIFSRDHRDEELGVENRDGGC